MAAGSSFQQSQHSMWASSGMIKMIMQYTKSHPMAGKKTSKRGTVVEWMM